MTTTPQELAANAAQLASFPDVAFRIEKAQRDDRSGAREIGALIRTDPALSAALLRVANSALYCRSGSIGSIERAVALVGLREVRDLAFGISVVNAFKGIPNELVSMEDFWIHSLHCAVAAQSLATLVKGCNNDSLFTMGLLHDIGHLVMFSADPEGSSRALELSLDENGSLSPYLSERKVFAFDHMAVGAELARLWQLPDGLRESIEFHHTPFASDHHTVPTLVVHVANSVAVLAELDSSDLDEAPPIDERALLELQLSPDHLAQAVTASQAGVSDLMQLFVG